MHVWQIEANIHFGRGYFARLIGTLVEAIFSLQLYKSEANRADPTYSYDTAACMCVVERAQNLHRHSGTLHNK